MERKAFDGFLKDLLPHLYDYAALETHPLVAAINPPKDFSGSRGEYVQKQVFEAIDKLQPAGIKKSIEAVEWRPYIILHNRYVEGEHLQKISSTLCLSERQVRRDHNRAVQALAARLWDEVFATSDQEGESDNAGRGVIGEGRTGQTYPIHQEVLDLNELVNGLAEILRKRVQDEDLDLEIHLSEPAPEAIGDRIIVRQILISLFNYALHMQSGKTLGIFTQPEAGIRIQFYVDDQWVYWRQQEHDNLLKSTQPWTKRLNARLQENYPSAGQPGMAHVELNLPVADQATILVVDDQQPTVRMFQRFLTRSGYKIVGVSDPSQVLPLARQIQPAMITLDVMMPRVDGWEILQALQLDSETRHIPVVVCSAWEEPELARSIGAVDFLKKPITQKDLLNVLERLNLQTV